ncbi:MAG: QueT transporter family protein [Ruminococcaceae bacterium]|nr:QueT transporter family protein [Oscillospiraceae bacterium]
MELIKLKNRKKIVNVSVAAIIAALYVVLTYLASAFGLASFAVQVRFSEALTILPIFTPAAIPGLFAGCVLANILTGCALWDIVFGSLATLLGALGTYFLKKHKIFATLPPIIANTVIVPVVLLNVYNLEGTYWFFALTVCLGEIISCGVLGTVLRKSLERSDLFDRLK